MVGSCKSRARPTHQSWRLSPSSLPHLRASQDLRCSESVSLSSLVAKYLLVSSVRLVRQIILETSIEKFATPLSQAKSRVGFLCFSKHLFVVLSFAGASTSRQTWTPYAAEASHARQNLHLRLDWEYDIDIHYGSD